jgi:hypothetical protein
MQAQAAALLEPLDLVQLGEQFLAVKNSWVDLLDPRGAQPFRNRV